MVNRFGGIAKKATARKRVAGASQAGGAAELRWVLSTLQGFRTIFGSARKHDAEVRRKVGISGSQLWAMSEVSRYASMSVNDLSVRMALHQTTASNIVNALVEQGLIRRSKDRADLRVVRLTVTGKGARVLKQAPGPYVGLLVDGLRKLTPVQLTRLNRSLTGLCGVMQDPAKESAGESLMGE